VRLIRPMTNTLPNLLCYVKPYWRMFLLGILRMVAYAATLPAAIVLRFVVRGLATFVAAYGINWVGKRLVSDLRNAMFAKLLAAPTA